MTETQTNSPVAPSAATPAGATAAAPVAASSAVPAAPSTLADFAALAAASLTASGNPALVSVEQTGSPTETEAPAEAPLELTPTAEGDDAAEQDPTPEELAGMSDSEQRILGALQKEREKRKEARAEVKAMRAELEALKQQLTATPKPEPTPAAEPQAAEPAATPDATATVLPSDPLADCQTFDQVDARAMQAAQLESRVLRLQQQLARDGAEPVRTALLSAGVKELNGQPLDTVDDAALGDFLTRAYEGARVTQLSAEPRKRFIMAQAQAFQEAQTILPELADAKSVRRAEFAAFVKANPWLPKLGPNWPVIAATHLVGQVTVKERSAAKAAPAPSAVPPVAKVATAKSAPAAPTRTASTLPQPKELDAIATKMANGTATPAEIATYASRHVTAPR